MDIETMTLDAVYNEGYDRGYSIASWNDLPDIGETIRRTIENKDDALEAFSMLCHEAESMNRCYTPFEHTAHALNDREDAEDAWDAFDEGIAEGIRAYIDTVSDHYDDDQED